MKIYTTILFLFVLYHANGQTITFSKGGVCASTGVEVINNVYYGIHGNSSGSICIGKFDTLGNVISTQNYPNIPTWIYSSPKLVSSVDGHLAIVTTRDDSLGLRGILVDFDTSGGIISETVLTIPNIGTDSITPYDLAATKDSGYIVVSAITYLGYSKVGVIKMDKNKNNQWEVLLDVYNGYNSGPIPDVCLDDDGGYLVSYQNDDCDFFYDCPNVSCTLTKLDSVGNIVWTWVHSGPNLRVKGGNDMTKTKDGGWAVASAVLREPNTGGGVSPPLHCGYVFKIDSAQNLLWSKRLEGVFYSWNDRTVRIIELEDSSLVTFGTVTDSLGPWTGQKGYIYKFSADGDSIWSRQYYHLQPTARHAIHDAEKLPDDGFLISGNYWSSGQYLGWLLKLDKHGCLVPNCHWPLGVLPTGALEDFRLSLYPNPTTDYLNVFYQSQKRGSKLTFSVVDIQGRVLQNYTTADVPDETYIVPVYDLVAGMYILQVRRDGQLLKSEQFIKR